MMKPSDQQLLDMALEARRWSYSPYSHFAVGAALLATSGKIYAGANVENASYGLSICAERVALFQAVARGERAFSALAVVGGPEGDEPDELCPPCGACRQALFEFAPDLRIILGASQGVRETIPLRDLLPKPFAL
jgi:cytidine deaminase